jgi:hypothetical protein
MDLRSKLKIVLLLVTSSVALFCNGQNAVERSSMRNMARLKWDDVAQPLWEVAKKDSLSPITPYILAQYYISQENPYQNVDSAYLYVNQAFLKFGQAPLKIRERAAKLPMDTLILTSLRNQIETIAYQQAKAKNQLSRYESYLALYAHAPYRDSVVWYRDEVAYQEAVALDTYHAFQTYLNDYPNAHRTHDALAHYHRLYYAYKTRGNSLPEYEQYLRDVPQTPFRAEVERIIFDRFLAEGSLQHYDQYLKQYKAHKWSGRAAAIYAELLKEEQYNKQSKAHVSSYLQEQENMFLIPFLHQSKYGFMNQLGMVVIPPTWEELDKSYWCGNITEDIVVIGNDLINRAGTVIYSGDIDALDDIGYGFLFVENDSCNQIVHKRGFSFDETCVDDVKIILGKFIAIKKNQQWSIWTLTGLQLQGYVWDQIFSVGELIALEKEGFKYLVTPTMLAKTVDGEELPLTYKFDDVKSWRGHYTWCKRGSEEGVVDQHLNVYIPMQPAVLEQGTSYVLAHGKQDATIYKGDRAIGTYPTVLTNNGWVVGKLKERWSVYHPNGLAPVQHFDSVFFVGAFVVGRNQDSLVVLTEKGKSIRLKEPVSFEFIAGMDSTFFIQLDQPDKRSLYNQYGALLFSHNYQKIQFCGDGLFIVTWRDKKGLVSSTGQVLLPFEYDAIGSSRNGYVSLLRAMKFGMYHIGTKKLIKPAYTKNVVVYSNQLLVGFKEGGVGFMDWDGKSIGGHDFSEIEYWSDSVALVKKGGISSLYHIFEKRYILEKLTNVIFIEKAADHKIAIVEKDGVMGVYDSHQGFVIPMTFTDIVNVGSKSVPVYFTEKHVVEASLFVVIYYDQQGKLLRKEVYEQDDYDRIYCASNY